MVLSLKWNTESNMLAALQDSRLTVYLYPSVIFVDKSLLGRTMIETGNLIIVIIEHKNPSNKANNIWISDASEFGKHPTLVGFVGNQLPITRADGSLVATAVTPYPAVVYNNAISNRWERIKLKKIKLYQT